MVNPPKQEKEDYENYDDEYDDELDEEPTTAATVPAQSGNVVPPVVTEVCAFCLIFLFFKI